MDYQNEQLYEVFILNKLSNIDKALVIKFDIALNNINISIEDK